MTTPRRMACTAVLSVALVGCGAAPAPAAPSASGGSTAPASATAGSSAGSLASEPWTEVDPVQPSAVLDAPSLAPGYQCHPCHYLAENQLFGVAPTPAGLIAVGVQQPPAQAIAFSSADGTHWAATPGFLGAAGTTAIAVTSAGGRTVIVGLDPSGATTWASDGGAWTQAPAQADLRVSYAAGAMTSVTPFDGGFVAGGYRDDPLHATASAATWRSHDGLTWTADDARGAFAGGRIWGLSANGRAIVAVGTNGDPNYGPATAWRWTQATGWQRARIGPDSSGAMRAVVATATGFVAVGLNGHDDGARAWISPDGLAWTAVPDQPSFHYYTFGMRMQSLVVGPTGLVAGGWRSDAAKGSGVTWTSKDGITWQPPTWQPSFAGGQITGVAVGAGGVVAVGRTGYPDWNQAAIWRTNAP